jgi:multiple sugar transport system substrate-binding protein
VALGQLFAQGSLAMMVDWFGFATHAHTSPDSAVRGQVDIAPIPAGTPGRSASLNVYWILALATGSPHRDLAWRFLRHTQTPAMDLLTSTSGAIGCCRSTWADPTLNAAIPFYHQLEALHASAREIPQRPDWPLIAALIDTLVTATLNTQTPIPTLLAQADAAFTPAQNSTAAPLNAPPPSTSHTPQSR